MRDVACSCASSFEIKKCFSLVLFLLLSVLPALSEAQFTPQELFRVAAQSKLLDGLRGSENAADPNWLSFTRDANDLPKTQYSPTDVSFWGVNVAGGITAEQRRLLLEANIKTLRYNIIWGMHEKNGPVAAGTDFERLLPVLAGEGFSIVATLDEIPSWANGAKSGSAYWDQDVAPHKAIEEYSLNGEVLNFYTASSVQLSRAPGATSLKPVLYTDLNPFVVVDENFQTLAKSEEFRLPDSYNPVKRLSFFPVQVGTEKVEVDFDGDGPGGFEMWTRVNNFLDLDNPQILPEAIRGIPRDQQKVYLLSRDGVIKFPNWVRQMWGYGILLRKDDPPGGIKVRITYKVYDLRDSLGFNKYVAGSDFNVNDWEGKLSRVKQSQLSGYTADEPFNEFSLARWQWLGAPADEASAVNGKLRLRTSNTSALGTFLYQEIRDDTANLSDDNDFTIALRLNSANKTGGSDYNAGIVVYKDENNWFRFALSDEGGRPLLWQRINGRDVQTGTGGAYGFNCRAARWLTVVKKGSVYEAFTSQEEADPFNRNGGCYSRVAVISASSPGPSTPGTPGDQSPAAQVIEFDYSQPQPKLKVGMSFRKNTPDGWLEVEVDRFFIRKSGLPQRIRVFYDIFDIDPWKSFVSKTIDRYKDAVKYWEIWNEPDQGWEWHASNRLMALMVNEAAKIIRAKDNSAKIVGPGYANPGVAETGYGTLSANMGNPQQLDLIAWHPYLFTQSSPDKSYWESINIGAFTNIRRNTQFKSQGAFFGEIATMGGATIFSRYANVRTQSEYGSRLMMYARRVPALAGIQWWPIADLADAAVNEWDRYGSHEGLLFVDNKTPKPIYYTYRNIARNKGVIVDLVSYDSGDEPLPAARTQQVSRIEVGVLDRAKLASLRVLSSLTNTDDRALPTKMAACFYGAAGLLPMLVNIDVNNEFLQTESWELKQKSSTTFELIGARSGSQGIATVNSPFTSKNKLLRFTIPAAPAGKSYASGDRFYFETFKGDGFREIAYWKNEGSITGYGPVVLNLASPVETRYLALHFERASGAQSFALDELKVYDENDLNISQGKLSLVDGAEVVTVGEGDPRPSIVTQPRAQSVTAGDYASFNVELRGSGSMSYQWQRDSVNIPGATSSTYMFRTTLADNGSRFRVLVQNSAGSVSSEQALLSVLPLRAPTITEQPDDLIIWEDEEARFSVKADGSPLLHYQWQCNGENIEGAVGPSLSFIAEAEDGGSKFSVIVRNAAGEVLSSEAQLRVRRGDRSARGAALDFDGDGESDPVTRLRTPQGALYRIYQSDDKTPQQELFARFRDLPVAADYDGDKKADLAIVRTKKSQLQWIIKRSNDGVITRILLGNKGDTVLAGCDLDGDAKDDPAVISGKSLRYKGSKRGRLVKSTALADLKLQNLICADLNGDGKDELLALAKGAGGKMQLAARTLKGKKLYTAIVSKPVGIFAVDINGDGRKDGGFYSLARGGSTILRYFIIGRKKSLSLRLPAFSRLIPMQFLLIDGRTSDGFLLYSRKKGLFRYDFVSRLVKPSAPFEARDAELETLLSPVTMKRVR